MQIEVGKSYRTRGGWRAVSLKRDGNRFLCWHDLPSGHGGHDHAYHHLDGQQITAKMYDLVEEWREPKTVRVRGRLLVHTSGTQEWVPEGCDPLGYYGPIACIEIDRIVAEGEGLTSGGA